MIRIAPAGNSSNGKFTLFNLLTDSNQHVGNWPGVTAEKEEGVYKRDKETGITDLPGIYSFSPYTLEKVVSRDYLVNGVPDVIIDIVDATNIERNLYLSTQLSELGIPFVLTLNMMDVVWKSGDRINIGELSKDLGCQVVEISALENQGVDKLVHVTKKVALTKRVQAEEKYPKDIEGALAGIEEIALNLEEKKGQTPFGYQAS